MKLNREKHCDIKSKVLRFSFKKKEEKKTKRDLMLIHLLNFDEIK